MPRSQCLRQSFLHKFFENGSKVSLVEAIPSALSCCRGILHGLWRMACASPTEVDETIIRVAYDLLTLRRGNLFQITSEIQKKTI